MEATQTTITVNGADLYCEITGEGEPLVLVHGGWSDHTTWRAIVPELAASFRVVAYDRRGHSRSRNNPDGPRVLHEDDLVALIEALGVGPVHLVGSSYGSLISLGVAARRPELVRSIVAHEPPGVALLAEGAAIVAFFQETADQLRCGNAAGGARRFVEEVIGAGMWDVLPADLRQTMVDNAPTFVATMDDPRAFDVDVAALAQCGVPILLTAGTETPAWLRDVVPVLAHAAGTDQRTFMGAGHMPHITHPAEHVEAVLGFCSLLRR
jgi:pimeloyl-ACP methyl ester carboxylesterase